MKKVYIAFRCYDYEGNDIIGVYARKQTAEKEIEKEKLSEKYCADRWEVQEWEIK